MKEFLKDKTVILATQNNALVQKCDEIILAKDGQITLNDERNGLFLRKG